MHPVNDRLSSGLHDDKGDLYAGGRQMIRPGGSLFISALCFLFLSAAAYFFGFLIDLIPLLLAAFVPFVAADFILLRFWTDRMDVRREIPASLVTGVRTRVRLIVSETNGNKKIVPGKIKIFDLYDDSFDCYDFPLTVFPLTSFPVTVARRPGRPVTVARSVTVTVARREKTAREIRLEYDALPVRRGVWEFSACELLLSSPLHFWRLKVVHGVRSAGKTYPEFSELASGTGLRAVIEAAGNKNVRKRGTGLEFKQLRGWQDGDSVRSIDWRATSRKNELVVREYIEEQDQHILLLLDSGYRLHRQTENSLGTRTQFDAALNAALLLSWVALKHGDSVSAGIFGNEERWVSPRKGVRELPVLINALYDVQSASVPSSIFSALEKAHSRLKRRTFIICISNFREEDEEELSRILPVVGRRHLLLMVSLSENEAEILSKKDFSGGGKAPREEVLTSAAASYYLARRKNLYKKWERSGLLVLDTNAASLSSTLINNFITVKRKGLL
jgi:uncharacterized protein (DUF58 family)